MGPQARVLIVAADDTLAGELSEGLDRFGWTTATARGQQSALAVLSDFPIEAAIVDVERLDPDVQGLGSLLKAAAHPRRIPVIAVGSPLLQLDPDSYDMVLAPPLHAPQIAMRIEQLVRAAVAEEEFELRAETFQDRGARLERPREPDGPIRVMAVGSPAPKFLALSNALQASGVETIGAFTAYTAFDYLHERPFDAVVLWGDDEAEAKAIAAGMRRNTRLFHIPTILYMSSESELDRAEAFDRGVTDMAAPDVPETETARRVLALARTYRRQSAVRRALENARGSGLMDSATGLFTRDLFAAHLARLASASRERNRRLSVCVLKVAESADVARVRETGKLDRAMPQIGSMISRLVRAEDTAARLGPELFALALPATAEGAARLVAERIGAVVGCTAFDAGEGRQPFVVEFDLGVAELRRGETAIDTLERAAEAARTKTRAAS